MTERGHMNKHDDIFDFLIAQEGAEKANKTEFKCPVCGGRGWWRRSKMNGQLYCGCEDCGLKIIE